MLIVEHGCKIGCNPYIGASDPTGHNSDRASIASLSQNRERVGKGRRSKEKTDPDCKRQHSLHQSLRSQRVCLGNDISTRRFFSRPSSVSLLATGIAEPNPVVRPGCTPRFTNSFPKTCPRSLERARL